MNSRIPQLLNHTVVWQALLFYQGILFKSAWQLVLVGYSLRLVVVIVLKMGDQVLILLAVLSLKFLQLQRGHVVEVVLFLLAQVGNWEA